MLRLPVSCSWEAGAPPDYRELRGDGLLRLDGAEREAEGEDRVRLGEDEARLGELLREREVLTEDGREGALLLEGVELRETEVLGRREGAEREMLWELLLWEEEDRTVDGLVLLLGAVLALLGELFLDEVEYRMDEELAASWELLL